MTNLQAQIILKNRAECMQRIAKMGERCGRCSICPLRTSLDDYITAKEIVNRLIESRKGSVSHDYSCYYEHL